MTARDDLLSVIGFNDAANSGATPEALCNTYRAEILREAADVLEAWTPEPNERWTEREINRHEDGIDAAADKLRRIATEEPTP